MNTRKGLLHSFAFTLLLLMGLVALFAHTPPTVHAFAGDYALDFDGASDFVTAPTWASIIGPDWQTTKSISVWFRPMTAGQVVGQVVEGDMIVGDFPRWFGLYQATWNGQDAIWATNWDNVNPAVFIPVPYAIGEWVNITLVHDGGNLTVYKNGSFVAQAATGATATGHPGINSIALRIGGAVQIGGPPNFNCWETLFSGQVDEVSLWSNALSPEEVRQNLYRTLPANPNLRAYYQMSNGSGSILADNSGNGNQATLQDGRPIPDGGCSGAPPDGDTAAWVSSGAFAGPRNALAFTGGTDYVVLTETAVILGGGWAGGKTAELWAYPTGTAPSVGSAAAGDILIGNAYWGIARANIGGADRLWLYNNDGNEERVGIPYASGEWAHLALVHDGVNLNAYKNGALVGSVLSGNTANDADLLIGSGFEGQLDELRLWDSARSAPQIRENMFQTVRHDETGLAAYYRFDQQNDASVMTVYDTAVSSHHGTMTNITQTTAWVASTAFNTWIGSQSSDWADGANWSRYAAPTAADNVGIPSYPASHAPLMATAVITINNLLINTGATLTIPNAGTLVNDGLWFELGTLANNGRIKQTKSVNGGETIPFFELSSYGAFTITTDADDNLDNVRVAIRGNQDCTTIPGETVLRCYDIDAGGNQPTNGATLTFSFLEDELDGHACSDVDVYHWDGEDWGSALSVDERQCDSEPYTIRVTDVTDFSPFVLAADNAPTAVQLSGLGVGETAVLPITFLLLALILLLPTTRLLNGRRQTR